MKLSLGEIFEKSRIPLLALAVGVFAVIVWEGSASAQEVGSGEVDGAVVVEDSSSPEIFAVGRTVIVRSEAKNVLTFGGDIVVEGAVTGDVAAVGGSVLQRSEASIGGDVFVLGGTYRAEGSPPKRIAGRETLVYAGYEEEIRELVLNPSSILSPDFDWAFVAQRFLSLLFWFILSMGITTVAPGSVGRAVAAFRLSPIKLTALGITGFLVISVGLVLALSLLPAVVSTAFGLMVLLLLLVSYIFGRTVLQATVGKAVQKALFPRATHSEVVAVFLGVLIWTVVLSVPYLWTVAAIFLFAASLGLVWASRDGRLRGN